MPKPHLPVFGDGILASISAGSGRSRTSARKGPTDVAGTSFALCGSFRGTERESGLFEATADKLRSGENG
jgi:hypothetical protein